MHIERIETDGNYTAAHQPSVGVFWGIDQHNDLLTLVSRRIELALSQRCGEYLVYPAGHDEIWRELHALSQSNFQQLGLPEEIRHHNYNFYRGDMWPIPSTRTNSLYMLTKN